MSQRRTTILGHAVAALLRTVETFTRRVIPPAPAGRPTGGPVVFRHYL